MTLNSKEKNIFPNRERTVDTPWFERERTVDTPWFESERTVDTPWFERERTVDGTVDGQGAYPQIES